MLTLIIVLLHARVIVVMAILFDVTPMLLRYADDAATYAAIMAQRY